MNSLRIAADLALPLDAATQTLAFIARKGAGKTYGASKFAELLMDAGIQVVVLDSVGNWYGLRLAADGKSPGFDIPIFGGLRGDIPLEAAGGALIADVVVETGRSIIVDMSQFNKADRQRFATAFGQRLWQAKKAERQPSPVMLIIEESQLIVPESVRGDSATMVGTYEEIIRLGRNYGIGVTMISQRPQSVNKEVLNQTECLFVGQVNGAHERKALKDWIVHQGMDVKLLDELPSLPIGTMYVWSPQWLGILQKVKIAAKRTFDASATPKVGATQVRRDLKPLDLKDLQQKMADTIERAKADDPKELRKAITQRDRKIADLEKQLVSLPEKGADISTAVEQATTPLVRQIDGLQSENAALRELISHTGGGIEDMVRHAHSAAELGGQLLGVLAKLEPPTPAIEHSPAIRQPKPAENVRSESSKPGASLNGQLTGPQQRIVDGLAELRAIGVKSAPRQLLVFMAGYGHVNTKSFSNALSSAKAAGVIEYGGGQVSITPDGLALANHNPPPRSQRELHERVFRMLSGPAERVLGPLLQSYPQEMTKEQLVAESGYGHLNTKSFQNTLSKLRKFGLIDYPQPGRVVATDLLFPEGLR